MKEGGALEDVGAAAAGDCDWRIHAGSNILDFGLASSPSSKWGGTPETD